MSQWIAYLPGILFAPLLLGSIVWRERSALPLPRAGYIAGVIDGKMVIAGGSYWESGSKIYTTRTDLFDPKSNAWSAGPPLPQARGDVGCVSLQGVVYVFGGLVDGVASAASIKLDSHDWADMDGAALPEPRIAAMTVVIRDRVYLLGGLTEPGAIATAARTLWRWSPGAGWKTLAEFPGPSRVSAAVVSLGGKMYVFGGGNQSTTQFRNLQDVWVYDPDLNRWSALPDLPVARRAWSAMAANDSILLLGGYTDTFSREVYRFDPRANSCVRAGDLLHATADARYVEIGGRLYSAGGEAGIKIRAPWTIESQ